MAASDQRCDLIQRLNDNLADDLSFTLDELDALKRTVIDSHTLVVQPMSTQSKSTKVLNEDEFVIPAFLRVMQAEQTLMSNLVYETNDVDEQTVASFQQKLKGDLNGRPKPINDESSEVDVENESSIPQESSIANNISFQNQRRATGTLNAGGGGIGQYPHQL